MDRRTSFSFHLCLSLALSIVHFLGGAQDYTTGTILESPESVRFRIVLAPHHKTTLSSQVRSQVVNIQKLMGQSFEDGEVLLQLDETVFKANELQARADLERAQAQLAAKEELYSDHVASYLELKEAQAEHAKAEAEFVIAKKNLDSCQITAPYRGRVVEVKIDPYEMVQSGDELISIVDDKILLAQLLIPSSYYQSLSLGQIIPLHIDETGSAVDARISHIGATIDPASSMLKVYAEVDNSKSTLRSGMIGMTTLEKKQGNTLGFEGEEFLTPQR